MSNKPIITVDVDDAAFVKFQKDYQEYADAVKKQSSDWAKANGEISKSAKSAAGFAASVRSMSSAAGKSVASFKKVAGWTKNIASNLANSVKSLLRMLSIGGVVGGLLGAGGLFGIGRLAGSADNARRQSQGFGISSGDLRAARTNYNRYIDADSTLGGINEAQRDLSKRWTLSSLGFNQRQINSQSPAEMLPELLPRLVQAFKQGGGTVQGAEARGLTQFADIATLTRLSKLSPEELQKASSQYQSDRQELGNSDATLRKWQDLNAQLTRAGEKIQAVFIDGLEPLAPVISKLSASFAEWLKVALRNPEIGKWISEFAGGIEKAANYLGSSEAQENFKAAIDGVKAFGKAIGDILKFFGYLPTKETPSEKGKIKSWYELQKEEQQKKAENRTPGKTTFHPAWWNLHGKFDDDYQKSLKEKSSVSGNLSEIPNKANAAAKFSFLEKKYQLAVGELDRIWMAESSRGKKMLSPVGAKGHFGFMDKTAKEYGLKDPNNLEESAAVAAQKLSNLRKYYKGDDEKARAAYNWGEGNLDKSIAKHGADWKNHLPAETSGYLSKTNPPTVYAKGGATVSIYDNTGGNVNIISSQLAY